IREATRLAFNDTGRVAGEQAAAHQSPGTAQALGVLPSLAVPGTFGGQTFAVQALAVTGHISLDGAGRSEDDYYSFTGLAGQLFNFEVISNTLDRVANPIDSVLRIFDGSGRLLASNDDEFESQDARLVDFVLPADGTYFVEVDTFTPDGTQAH